MPKFVNIVYILCFLCAACASEENNSVDEILGESLFVEKESEWASTLTAMPDDGCVPLRVRLSASLPKMLDDLNPEHIAEARKFGVKPPGNLRELWDNTSIGLVKISSCREYYVAPLTHSYPYLVSDAANLLREIGCRFADSLAAHGGGAYRPKVTSVYRTPGTVQKLRRVNVNASNNSAHAYATTFDISYSKFVCDDSTATRRTQEDLKNLLGRIVADLRDEGRCLVKYERKQACFHITAKEVKEDVENL